ncbi:MAG: type II secretion system protein GspG [Planctomycetes bacterium]|nr:type II secretion system protein GspG [Planctomycetota bacterium]
MHLRLAPLRLLGPPSLLLGLIVGANALWTAWSTVAYDPAGDRVAVELRALDRSLKLYKFNTGHYPERLEELWRPPAGEPRWQGPYLERGLPRDPWGTPYVYYTEGGRSDYVLVSLGADRAWGGGGRDAEQGRSGRRGAFTSEVAPRPAPTSPVLAGVLSASFALLPGGALLFLLWVRRRRANAPPPPEVVLASLGGRCAYCHDDAFGVAAPCPDCGALLHGSCWLEAAECPSLGCRGRPRTSFALLPQPATIQVASRGSFDPALPVVPFGLPRTA